MDHDAAIAIGTALAALGGLLGFKPNHPLENQRVH